MQYRDELIDAYFRALDEEEFGPLEEAFTPDVTYSLPAERVEGRDALMDYFRNHRRPTGTVHEVHQRIHGETASAVEGHVTGRLPERGEFEGEWVDVFEFDHERERLSRVGVYHSGFDVPESDRA